MLPDRVSNPGPLTYESGATRPGEQMESVCVCGGGGGGLKMAELLAFKVYPFT